MFGDVKISPSILSANFLQMGDDIRMIEEAGAGFVHVDVMDGHFVPNLTMGVPLVKQLKRATALPLDVHLMISNPMVQAPWFLKAGADILTAHVEAFADVAEMREYIDLVHGAGAKAALSVKPKTPVEALEPVIEDLDLVLVMSVEPGFSGQSYIEGSEDKVRAVVEMARAHGVNPLIEVDGGIGVATAPGVCAEGADVLVCGNAVFAAADPAAALQAVQEAGTEAQESYWLTADMLLAHGATALRDRRERGNYGD